MLLLFPKKIIDRRLEFFIIFSIIIAIFDCQKSGNPPPIVARSSICFMKATRVRISELSINFLSFPIDTNKIEGFVFIFHLCFIFMKIGVCYNFLSFNGIHLFHLTIFNHASSNPLRLSL